MKTEFRAGAQQGGEKNLKSWRLGQGVPPTHPSADMQADTQMYHALQVYKDTETVGLNMKKVLILRNNAIRTFLKTGGARS